MAVKFVKYLMLPVAVLLFLPGSVARRPKPSLPVVCRVEVDCRQGSVHQHRHYTSSEKMGWVLNFMRMQKNLGRPEENPEAVPGDSYTVYVYLTDGKQRVYRQQADRYLQMEGKAWQRIDPKWGGCLYYLLQTLPSDPY